MIGGASRVVALIGDPVDHSLSPRMQNAAFAARALDWTYVALRVRSEDLPDAIRGLVALGFAGANVTTPHKTEAAQLVGAGVPSVNTLVIRDGVVEATSTDAAILDGLTFEHAAILGDGGSAAAFAHALPDARRYSRRTEWPPRVNDADLVVNATSARDDVLVELREGQTLIDLPYPRTATAEAAATSGATVVDGLDVLVAQGAASFTQWTGVPAPVDVMHAAVRSA